MSDSAEENKSVKPFGLSLKEARESLGLSLDELPKTLNLDIDTLEALENSDVAKLPPAIYVQGYIKAYTKALGISSETIHAEYLKTVGRDKNIELKPRSTLPLETNSETPIVKTFTILLAVLALSAALFGVYNYYSTKVEHDSSSTEKIVNQKMVIPLLKNRIVITQNAQLTSNDELIVTQSENTEVSAATNVDEQSQQKNDGVDAQITANLDSLGISAIDESWADIRDANQTKMYLDNLKKNDALVLTGVAPFDIFLGNAPSVTIEVNGVEVDMSDYIRINNVAHFKVSEKSNHIVFH